jgi:hypothetical protein
MAITLAKPYEYLELRSGESIIIQPLKYTIGSASITKNSGDDAGTKTIDILRLFYDKDPTTPGIEYWDISGATLIYQLMPMLDQVITGKKSIKITAFGQAPRKRFTVEVL